MRKLSVSLLIVFATTVFTVAQGAGDFNKSEYYVGFSHEQFDDGGRMALNGFEVAYTRNLTRYIGLKGDVSGAFGSDVNTESLATPGGTATARINRDTTVFNVTGGVQFKDNAQETRLKPFAHVLGGMAYKKDRFSSTCTGNCTGIAFPNGRFSNTGAAALLGGGLDIRLNDKIDIRAIQVDFNPITTGGGGSNNVRFGAGIVFKN